MKVGELIEKLQQLPADDAVGIFERYQDPCECGCGVVQEWHQYEYVEDVASWGIGRWVIRS